MSRRGRALRRAGAVALVVLLAACGDGTATSAFEDDIPADFAAPPELCKPDSPELREPGPVTPVEDVPAGVALRTTVENSAGQTFELIYWGRDEALVRRDIAQTRICLEAQPTGDPAGASGPSLDGIVVDALAEVSGRTVAELAAARDRLMATDSPTLADLAAALGADMDDVAARARAAATQQFPGRGADEIDSAVREILDEPDAPFLGETPADEAGYAELVRESADVVVVEVRPTELGLGEGDRRAVEEPLVAVSFYVDPSINRDRPVTTRYYVAKCQRSASVRLRAERGRMSVSMTRSGVRVGSRVADRSGNAEPKGLYSSSAGRRTYDIKVRGWKNNSSYHVHGGWTLGSGGGC